MCLYLFFIATTQNNSVPLIPGLGSTPVPPQSAHHYFVLKIHTCVYVHSGYKAKHRDICLYGFVYLLTCFLGSNYGLVGKDSGFVIKFRVRIQQRFLVVLEKASNLKVLLCYVGNSCSVASIVGDSSVTPKKKKKQYKLLTWEWNGSNVSEYIFICVEQLQI